MDCVDRPWGEARGGVDDACGDCCGCVAPLLAIGLGEPAFWLGLSMILGSSDMTAAQYPTPPHVKQLATCWYIARGNMGTSDTVPHETKQHSTYMRFQTACVDSALRLRDIRDTCCCDGQCAWVQTSRQHTPTPEATARQEENKHGFSSARNGTGEATNPRTRGDVQTHLRTERSHGVTSFQWSTAPDLASLCDAPARLTRYFSSNTPGRPATHPHLRWDDELVMGLASVLLTRTWTPVSLHNRTSIVRSDAA